MKVVNIGCGEESYNISLVECKKSNQHGVMYYFNERIMLRKTKPVTDYLIWVVNGRQDKVAITDNDLKNELTLISTAINKSRKQSFDFKIDTDRIYIKLSEFLPPIPLHHELLYTVAVYGVFCKNANNKAYLQMEVSEVAFKPLNLLQNPWPLFNSPNDSGFVDNEETNW